MIKLHHVNNQKGIGLIEVVVSLGIATMVITALVSLSIFTLRSSLKSKLFLEGSKVANRELELIRAYRDKNTWSTFVDGSESSLGMTNCSPDVDNLPKCYINLDATAILNGTDPSNIAEMPADGIARGFYAQIGEDDVVSVTVVVQWKEGLEIKNTTLRSDLTNWQQK